MQHNLKRRSAPIAIRVSIQLPLLYLLLTYTIDYEPVLSENKQLAPIFAPC